MSSLAEIVGQRQPPQDSRSETTPFVTQKSETASRLTARLYTHARGANEGNSRPGDLLIEGLFDRLPEPNGLWPLAERARWLRTAASIFDLVYKIADEESGEISIAFTKTEGTERPDVEQKTR